MTVSCRACLAAGFFLLAATAITAGAADGDAQTLVIKSDAFQPKALTLPADKRVQINVSNQSGLPAEFEGKDFSTEKVIPAGTTLPVYIGPLKAGTYHFFNEFSSSVSGTLTVK